MHCGGEYDYDYDYDYKGYILATIDSDYNESDTKPSRFD